MGWTQAHSYIRGVTSKDMPHSTGDSARYSVGTYMQKDSKKEWIYRYIFLNHFAIHLKLTVNQLYAQKIKIKKKMRT